MQRFVTIAILVAALFSGATAPSPAQPATSGQTGATAAATPAAQQNCEQLVQGSSMSDEGRRAIQQLMGSDRAPQLMDRLMKLAKGVGNGDTVTGMERVVSALEKGGGVLGGFLKPQ